jgi:drug/metabolite transporter (DMT)-like permease
VLALLAVPILGQRLTPRQLLAIGISFAGAVLIVTGGQLGFAGGLSPAGVTLALGSTLIWAVFWLVNARDGADPIVKLTLGFGAGLLLALLASPLFGGLALPAAAAWPAVIYVGLFEMGVTFVLWLSALQLTASAARLGQTVYLAPFLSLLFLQGIIGEPIQPTTPVGLALIVGAILWQRGSQRPSPE